jgi:hypothetical protein
MIDAACFFVLPPLAAVTRRLAHSLFFARLSDTPTPKKIKNYRNDRAVLNANPFPN